MPPRKLSDEQATSLAELYTQGMGSIELGKKFGLHHTNVRVYLRRQGVPIRPVGVYDHPHGAANRMYRGGPRSSRKVTLVVFHAIRAGRMKRETACKECGSDRYVEAHHDDYNKPFDVRWLCRRCHHAWHVHNRAVPLCDVEGICSGLVRKYGAP